MRQALGELTQRFRPLIGRFIDVDKEKLSTVAMLLEKLTQVDHSLTEDVSAKAAKDEHDRLVSTIITEPNEAVFIQGRQTKIRRHHRYLDPIVASRRALQSSSLR